MRPQTNGMVERFNGRIEDVLQSHRFHSGEDLEQTLLRYAHLYNSQLPQSVLKGRSPINALKDWQRQRPELSGSGSIITWEVTASLASPAHQYRETIAGKDKNFRHTLIGQPVEAA